MVTTIKFTDLKKIKTENQERKDIEKGRWLAFKKIPADHADFRRGGSYLRNPQEDTLTHRRNHLCAYPDPIPGVDGNNSHDYLGGAFLTQ